MNLIIVESPTKAKTINKFLAGKYNVESSFGHIRDLPASELGVDIENNFTPKYVIPTRVRKTVSSLKSKALKAKEVILASDEDREGEAIAWHLVQALNLKEDKIKRIVFHEITKDAILKALESPRQLNLDMVNAQQARRILDRLVGYKLSPFLWKKVAKGLSAGRVQSVATRMIIEREREITAFNQEEYWTITVNFKTVSKEDLSTNLLKIDGKSFDKLSLKKGQALEIKKILTDSKYLIKKIENKKTNKQAGAPFTTSTLQQTANRYLGYSAKQTMTVAQKLYEKGFITYMRTDSLNLSPKFIEEAAAWIKQNLGKEYYSGIKVFKNKSKGAQEAHEAIRPTEASASPELLEKELDSSELRLYRLIWQKAIASQMAAAQVATSVIDVEARAIKTTNHYLLRANGQIIVFPGYLKIWPEKTKEQALPVVQEKEKLNLKEIITEEHFTQPPARYSDAGLVKELEKHGIGRPSTYAPIIATIIARNYVIRDENKRLKPTDIAFVVIDLLINHFPKIVDYKFTAKLEEDLDLIANGKIKWQPLISTFYEDFSQNLENKYQEINKDDIMPIEESKEICDKCGAKMIIKTGRYGKFLACSAFPECRNIKKIQTDANGEKIPIDPKLAALEKKHAGEVCDKCGAEMKIKTGKYGPFLACSAYPKCKNIKNITADNNKKIPCPICQEGEIIKKFSRRGPFYACSNYPKCTNAYSGEPTGDLCKKCTGLMIKNKTGKSKCSNKDCKK